MVKIYSKIKKCRISNDKSLKKIIDFGNISLTGVFPKTKKNKIKVTPLELVFSKKSNLLQLRHNYEQKYLFGNNYGYQSSLNNSMIEHLNLKYKYLLRKANIKKNEVILDIGSNDGTFLNFFSKTIKKIGCDPTAKKFKKNYKDEIKIVPKIFNNKSLKFLGKKKFKLITSIAMFYDLKDPLEFCKLVEKILHKDGIFHIEIAYLPDIINKLSFDTFCQEHLTYFSFTSFNYLINQTDFKIINFNRNSINGGSINFDLAFKDSNHKINIKKIKKIIKFEKRNKIDQLSTYKKFAIKVRQLQNKIHRELFKIKDSKIYGFGASTKGNVTLQFCKIDNKIMKAIYDVNPEKFNCYTPNNKILIKDEKNILKDKPDYIVFLIWHFKKTILEKFKKFRLKNTKFIWLFPKFKIKANHN